MVGAIAADILADAIKENDNLPTGLKTKITAVMLLMRKFQEVSGADGAAAAGIALPVEQSPSTPPRPSSSSSAPRPPAPSRYALRMIASLVRGTLHGN